MMTRAIRLAAVLAVTASSLLILAVEPAAADECLGRGCQHQGDVIPGGFSAWAALASVWSGSGGPSGPQPCSFERTVPDPEALTGADPGIVEEVDGFIQVHVSGEDPLGPGVSGNPYVIVSISCNEPGYDHQSMEFGAIQRVDLLQWAAVPLMDPAELIQQALADMPVGSPDIRTSPGDGNPGLVGTETWLLLDEAALAGGGSRTDTDGPVSVTVWAYPDPSRDVVWDTGEGTRACAYGAPDGTCTWTYQRSSIDQPNVDDAGRPAYGITASVTYIGGYSVSLFGDPVGGVDNLGDITSASEPYLLAVEEAQALNTTG